MKRTGKVWTRIFPNIPVSKPTEVRMGKGKGSPEYACWVKPGRIIFEVDGVTESYKVALYKASENFIKTNLLKDKIMKKKEDKKLTKDQAERKILTFKRSI